MMLVAFCLQKRVDIAMILPIMVNVLISVLTNWKRGERMEDNTRISSLLKMIDIRIRQDLDARNQDLHISSSQMRTLSYLISNADHEINPRDLEQYFRISKPTVAGILKRLEEKGFITKRKEKVGKRVEFIYYHITDSGLSELQTMYEDYQKFISIVQDIFAYKKGEKEKYIS